MSQTATSPDSPLGDVPPPHTGDPLAHDAELDALPAPPRARRVASMTALALACAASLGMLVSLRADIAYFFATPRAIELGEAHAIPAAQLDSGAFVHVTGTPMVSRTVHYRRALGDATYALFPLAGQRLIFVQLEAEETADPRHSERRDFSGRLVTFGELGGRMGAVRSYLRETMDLPVTAESFVLVADEPPGTFDASMGLALFCLLCLGVNLTMLVRWFRPLRA